MRESKIKAKGGRLLSDYEIYVMFFSSYKNRIRG